jgi:glycosyltransferase involved in cell wall biosynthesis
MPTPPLPHRRLRILQVVSHLALGGAERVALTIAHALRGEIDFHIFAVRGIEPGPLGSALAAEIRSQKIPLHLGARVPMRLGGVVTSGIQLTRVIKRVRPDFIHLHTEIPEAAYAAMATCSPPLRAIPVVRTIHNTVFWKFWRGLGRWCDRRMPRAFVAGVSPGCAHAFSQLRRESGAAPPPENPVTIFNGVRLPPDVPAAPVRRHDDPLNIVFGGRFEPQKGTDLLPDILARVRPPAGGARLVLFGSGSHETLLRDVAKKPPAGWTVQVRSPTSDFVQQLSHFDLAILPSRFEGLCLVAVEACLARRPVVATDIAGLRDVFFPGYPWLARPNDATDFAAKLQAALDAPDRWPELGDRSRQFARERFSIDVMAAAYRSLYDRACAPQRSPDDP